MADIQNPKLLYFKAGLFVSIGALAAVLIVLEHPTLRVAGLLALAIWAFARAYYFAFYVIEHYIDSRFRFAGLSSVAHYLWKQRKVGPSRDEAKAPAEDRVI